MTSALETRALANAAYVNLFHVRWQECVKKGLRVIELARRVDDPQAEVNSRCWAAFALLCLGDSEAARLHMAAS